MSSSAWSWFSLAMGLDRFFLQPIANENQDHALELMKHPRTVVTFSDSGAHVSQIMDASLQTHLLSHWVRAKHAFTLEQGVRMLSFEPATHWGFADRGLIREGLAADLLVFDPDTIAPEMPEVVHDLPAGARRLVQLARGISATVVNGETVLRGGKPPGALPGPLLRGPLAGRSGPAVRRGRTDRGDRGAGAARATPAAPGCRDVRWPPRPARTRSR